MVSAQFEESYCDSVYEKWANPPGFIEIPIPEIEVGVSSLYSNLIYPDSAITAGLEVSARVWLIVSKDGSPRCIRFVKLKNEIFKSSILAAIEKQKFKPVIINDSPVDASLVIPFNFKLK
ncbi:MAG: hypothetical protein BalsKO_19300 [Balneolaceae bacterium]